ncbi:septum site-determining protein MinC [Sporolactobacillus terrae]|uniref:Probable septum site-determining protein MinC n=1 Tax=Sporolactobacillus terrae TaxID=269673 RepID=A0A410DA30_9BACL|nr:septum site-determining protein MinC [Sporolactobacillus terrae]QAA22925.1 septum site-determining protein MinC [Sporolactobacillus terrae]QAA25898.1 septum site-determining protein MinC [Sporolactobacillus terrae]UAK17773.1 septum site-determining protein MinC [Sporolactobacillus terrae]BBN99322.1 septum site-determining protein MinC [Sporolactobacillus terrae]
MPATQSLVTIKGRKDGLVLVMNEACAYRDLLIELKEKLAASTNLDQNGPVISVKIEVGNRYISTDQRDQLKQIIHSYDHLKVEAIHSNVLTYAELDQIKEQEKIVTMVRIVRSGQVLSVQGNLLLIGDVNPGGVVSASGNIYVLGSLRGVASAGQGEDGNNAVIVASIMAPTQLKIGETISRNERNTAEVLTERHRFECAYLDDHIGKIVIDHIQATIKKGNLPFTFNKM